MLRFVHSNYWIKIILLSDVWTLKRKIILFWDCLHCVSNYVHYKEHIKASNIYYIHTLSCIKKYKINFKKIKRKIDRFFRLKAWLIKQNAHLWHIYHFLSLSVSSRRRVVGGWDIVLGLFLTTSIQPYNNLFRASLLVHFFSFFL